MLRETPTDGSSNRVRADLDLALFDSVAGRNRDTDLSPKIWGVTDDSGRIWQGGWDPRILGKNVLE